MIVTSDVGRAQCAGERIIEIRSGDIVWFAPGERHREGATPDQRRGATMNGLEISAECGDGSETEADDPDLADSEEAPSDAICDIGVFGLAAMSVDFARNAARESSAVAGCRADGHTHAPARRRRSVNAVRRCRGFRRRPAPTARDGAFRQGGSRGGRNHRAA